MLEGVAEVCDCTVVTSQPCQSREGSFEASFWIGAECISQCFDIFEVFIQHLDFLYSAKINLTFYNMGPLIIELNISTSAIS